MGWAKQSRARVAGLLTALAFAGGGLLALLFVFGVAPQAGGVVTCTDTYTGAANGSWNVGTNWSTGNVPGSLDKACINTGAGTITYSSGNSSIDGVTVASGDTLSVTGGSLQIEGPPFTSPIANLSVAGGTFIADNPATITSLSVSSGSFNGYGSSTASTFSWTGGYIGNGNTGDGQLTVSGATTINTQTGSFIGSIALFLNGATTIEANGSSPGFSVNNQASVILGDTSTGPTIAEGATINSSGTGFTQVNPGVTLTVTGSSGAQTNLNNFFNQGTVSVPASGTLLVNYGTSPGVFNVAGTGTLDVLDSYLDGAGTDVSGSSSTLEVYNSTFNGTLSVGDLTGYQSGSTTYFNGPVTAATIQTGSLGSSNQEPLWFAGPSVTASTALDVYGAGIAGPAPISAATLNWTAGSFGNGDSSISQTITVSGATTITTPSSSNPSLFDTTLALNGPVQIGTASVTTPAFMVGSNSAVIFGDTASGPTIQEGAAVNSSGNGFTQVDPGVTLTVTGSDGAQTNLNNFFNEGTVSVPSNGTLLINYGTSPGVFDVAGAGTLDVLDSYLNGAGTDVSGSSSTLQVYNSTFNGSVDVSDLTGYQSGSTTYFNGPVTAATLQTGPPSGTSSVAMWFDGPSVKATTALDLYGASISGTSPITAGSFNWTAGQLGNGGADETITVSGAATITPPSSAGASLYQTSLVLDGAVQIGTASMTTPSFTVENGASVILADKTTPPTIQEGATINGNGGGFTQVNPGVTLTLSGSDGAQTTINTFGNEGTVSVPASGTLLINYGTSPGVFDVAGAGTLDVLDSYLDGNGTDVSGSSSTLEIYNSTFNGSVDVSDLTGYQSGSTTYFNGPVTAATLQTGPPSGTSSVSMWFDGPSVTATSALDLYGGSIAGTAPISAAALNWTSGNFGNGSGIGQTITVSGATSITTPASDNCSVTQTSLVLDGAAQIGTASMTDPSFYVGNSSSLIFADTSSPPTIQEGATINGNGGGFTQVDPGVTLTVSGSDGAQTTINSFGNDGAVSVPASGTLLISGGTSSGEFDISGAGVLDVANSYLDGSGTNVSGTSATLAVTNSTFNGSIDVSDLTSYQANSSTYFNGPVTAATIQTGPSSGTSAQTLYFYGPSVSATTALDLYGGAINGSAPISAASFNWSQGAIGSSNSSNTTETITVSGQSSITTTTSSGSYLFAASLVLDGATTFGTSSESSPSFEISSNASVILADTSASPTVTAGEVISGNGILQIQPAVTLDAPSGSFTVSCQLVNRGGSLVVPAGGTLTTTNYGLTQYGGTTSLSPSSTLQVGTNNGLNELGGTVEGTGAITGNVNVKGGTIEGGTGGSSGTLTISGNLGIGVAGTLAATLDGTSAGSSYSQVVASTANLGGTLATSLASGYTPAAGNTYTVLATSATPSATFQQLTPALLGTKAYSLSYTSSGVQILIPTATAVARLTSTSPTSQPGQAVTFRVELFRTFPGLANGPAFVTFYAGNRRIGHGVVELNNGVASVTTRSLSAGVHTITARVFVVTARGVLGAVATLRHSVGAASVTRPLPPAAPATPTRHQSKRPTSGPTRRSSGASK